MHIPTRSSVLYGTRIYQLVVAIAFLVLICWCGVHRAWWDNINGPLAIGVIASILTFILTIFNIITHHRANNPLSGSTTKTIVRVAIEVVFLLLFIATAGLMLRSRTGCLRGDPTIPASYARCYPLPTSPNEIVQPNGTYDDQPLTEWNVAIAFSFLEIISFLATTFLVFIEDRSGKVGGGGASYA